MRSIHRRATLAALSTALLAGPSAAQLAPGPGPRCGIDVAFEQVGVHGLVTQQYHAVVLVSVVAGRQWTTAFEANPTGRAPSWGFLVGRERDLSRRPIIAGSMVRVAAAPGLQTCAALAARLRDLVAELNSSRVRYAPAPRLTVDGANSNSFAYWAVRKVNATPPEAPAGTYGYYGNLVD